MLFIICVYVALLILYQYVRIKKSIIISDKIAMTFFDGGGGGGSNELLKKSVANM